MMMMMMMMMKAFSFISRSAIKAFIMMTITMSDTEYGFFPGDFNLMMMMRTMMMMMMMILARKRGGVFRPVLAPV